jgi:tetratricopeptide (TPR) repeat protein
MAFNLTDQVLEDDPNNIEALTIAVHGSLASKDRRLQEQAGTLIDSAVGRIRDNERLLIARARIHMALEQPRRAIPELEAYSRAQAGRSSVPALITLADLYRNAGDMDEADKTITRAEALAPDRQIVIHARLLLKIAQNRSADLKGVSSAYIAARDQDPAIVLSAASKLMSLNTLESRQEVLKLFEHAATTWPTSLPARQGFGLTLYTMGEVGRAKRVYEGLLQDFPNHPQVLNDLAWILQEHDRDYERALALANQGIRLSLGDPGLLDNHLHLLDTRGTILMNMPNRLPEARQDLEKLMRLLPVNSPRLAKTLLKLGQVCIQLGDLSPAQRHLTRALEIDRGNEVFTAAERSQISHMLQKKSGTVRTTSGSGGAE